MTVELVPFYMTRTEGPFPQEDIAVEELPPDVRESIINVTVLCSAVISDGSGEREWRCSRQRGHSGWHVAVGSRQPSALVLAIGNGRENPPRRTYQQARRAAESAEEKDRVIEQLLDGADLKVVPLDARNGKNWFEFGIGQALLLTDLPVSDYDPLSKGKTPCMSLSPEMGWQCSRELNHSTYHRSTNFELKRVYAKWPRKD